jgi:hypothetical protein
MESLDDPKPSRSQLGAERPEALAAAKVTALEEDRFSRPREEESENQFLPLEPQPVYEYCMGSVANGPPCASSLPFIDCASLCLYHHFDTLDASNICSNYYSLCSPSILRFTSSSNTFNFLCTADSPFSGPSLAAAITRSINV